MATKVGLSAETGAARSQENCCDQSHWQLAYERFETPEQEVRKFQRRLRWFGARDWPRSCHIADLFCGRGNNLVALERLGFRSLVGVDLSSDLIRQYRGSAQTYVADCRDLPLAAHSCEAVIVHGGLHHLSRLPDDLDAVLDEIERVLTPGGVLAVAEPWLTPFLRLAHAVCDSRQARRASQKLADLATMIEHERETYFAWLAQPEVIRAAFKRRFTIERMQTRWGKLLLLARSHS